MTTATPALSAVSAEASSDEPWPRWFVAFVLLSLMYVSLTTVDLRVASVPFKLPVVASTIVAWAIIRIRRGAEQMPPSTVMVILVGVGIPLIWFAITELRIHERDPSQRYGTHYAVQEASRFIYLLLYLPLYDLLRCTGPWCGDRLWRTPVLALCAVTFGLYIAYLAGAHFGYTGTTGPFQGGIGVDPYGTFRAFVVNDILFIPALGLLLGELRASGASWQRGLELAAVLGAAYLSHTRGVWVGMCLSIAVTVALLAAWRVHGRVRIAVVAALSTAVIAGLVIAADPALGGGAAQPLFGRQDLSNAFRYQQAPQLVAAIQLHPALGSGLGATLPSGYTRSSDAPWSFELSYLQLIFQLGIVGMLALAALPISVVIRAARRIPRDEGTLIRLAAAIGALVGLLYACATNPYLMTSVGMLGLAIVIAKIDSLTASGAEPSETPG